MTEDKKHQLDKLAVSDILSYLGARVTSMEEHIRIERGILGLWEQTVCEIRGEIKSWHLIGPHTKQYATELCDKLEHSMCALAGGPYKLKYSLEEEEDDN